MTSSSYSRRTILRAAVIGTAGVSLGIYGSSASAAPDGRLRVGMSGPDVHELQIRVAGWAADDARQTLLPVNGIFDAATEAAVRRFQRAYGLPADGVADPATQERLAAMAKPDGSTLSFEWAQFVSPDGGDPTVREQVRRLMYKLEALRHKLDDRKVGVVGGLHEIEHRARLGGAADITVGGLTTYAVYKAAQTCGFSGLGPWVQSWLHCDNRAEISPGASWSWAGGTLG